MGCSEESNLSSIDSFEQTVKNRESKLASMLGEAIRKGLATDVLAVRMALDHFFEAKHEDCFVRAKTCVLKQERIKAV